MNIEFKRIPLKITSEQNAIIVGVHLLPGYQKITVSENGQICKDSEKILEIPEPHKPSTSALHPSQPILLVGSNTSKLFIVNVGNTNRVERVLDAVNGTSFKLKPYDGAPSGLQSCGGVTKVVWSPDGSTFVTGYGDGSVRLWSRQGVLRSVIIEAAGKSFSSQHAMLNDQGSNYLKFEPVLGLDFTADSRNLVVGRGKQVITHPLTQNMKSTSESKINTISGNSWNLPDSEFLVAASLSQTSGLILVITETDAGNKSVFRIYDLLGRQIGKTGFLQNVQATSCEWSPNGELAIIGLANSAITLVNSAGSQICTVKVGDNNKANYELLFGVYTICWKEQLIIAGKQNILYQTQIFGQTTQFEDVLLSQVSANTIHAVHTSQDNDIIDKLQTKEAILSMKLGGSRKIVLLTKTQIYTYSLDNLNSPSVIPLPRQLLPDSVKIELSHDVFVIHNLEQAFVFQYDGRQTCQIRLNSSSSSIISTKLSNSHFWTLVKDNSILAYDLTNGSPVINKTVILKSTPKKFLVSFDDQIGYLSQDGDLFYCNNQSHVKLYSNVKDASFNETSGISSLVCLCENRLVEWISVGNVLKTDSGLLKNKEYPLKLSSTGNVEKLFSYKASPIAEVVLSPDSVHVKTSPWVKSFYKSIENINGLLRLCQMAGDEVLWASLTALALEKKNYQVAELCYAALDIPDKVAWLNENAGGADGQNSIFNDFGRNNGSQNNAPNTIELKAFSGDFNDAEQGYLRENKLLNAIHLNIKHSKWDRALNLAVNNKEEGFIGFVLGLRARYLEDVSAEETIDKFRQVGQQVKWEWSDVKQQLSGL